MTDRRQSNTQEAIYSTLSVCTIRGVCEDKVLELRPLCVKSSNEFEGIHRVPQETLRITGGCCREKLQFVRPSGCKHKELYPQCNNLYMTASFTFNLHLLA